MPRVVPNQKERFDKDELIKKLAQESDVKYSAFRELQHDGIEFSKYKNFVISLIKCKSYLYTIFTDFGLKSLTIVCSVEFVHFSKDDGSEIWNTKRVFNVVK